MPEDDDRYEWIDVSTYGGGEEWMRGRCLHQDIVPVHSEVTGERVALLCTVCDDAWDLVEGWREL